MYKKISVIFIFGITLLILFVVIFISARPKVNKDLPTQHFVDSVGIEFVRIPAGEFKMGNDESVESLIPRYPQVDPERLAAFGDEAPVHQVKISNDFYLGVYEVTLGQFKAFLKATGYIPQSIAENSGAYGYSAEYDKKRPNNVDAFEECKLRYSYDETGWPQSDNHPVVNISWYDAQAMVSWLSHQEGVRYRLPTEAEWEYSCRAGALKQYAHGNDPKATIQYGNLFDMDATPYWKRWTEDAAPGHDGFAFTAPVGQYPPNAFGLHDMMGNAWEWVSDWYGEDYYSKSALVDPQGPVSGTKKIRRGGSFHTWPIYARCSYRNYLTPDSRYTLVGMRLLREIPTDSTKYENKSNFTDTFKTTISNGDLPKNKSQVKGSKLLSENFDKINADKDCTIDQAEINAFKVMTFDKDNDGSLDKKEIKNKEIVKQFELLDKDKDGSLDRSEILTYFRKKK